MPRDKSIKKVLVIGSGPIVIGQAAEFDYAGAQACRVLKAEGINVVLVNSNPATIMTDSSMADEIYLEPLTVTTLKRIIEKEKPDSLLAGLGGQTGLTLATELAESGFLAKNGVRLIGSDTEAIKKAEDRQLFKETMAAINEPTVPSETAENLADALKAAEKIGYPVIIRPAFTLGVAGGGVAYDSEQMVSAAQTGLDASPITQILIEKYIYGWKEIEFETMRDSAGNVIAVCSMENLDPVGIHTGDSIVVAPALTLADKEYQMLRSAALNIITSLNIVGGCNCQFALDPESFNYSVIEVNPRVSRSSALASKATGYPIAKITVKTALGYTLDEITNDITGKSCAASEPALDYTVVKFPKWPFDKFAGASRTLGTQMKATGEVMAIGATFEEAFLKAVRGAEIKTDFPFPSKKAETITEEQLKVNDDQRIFTVFNALFSGISPEKIHDITKIDKWFLYKLKNIADYEKSIADGCNAEQYLTGKKLGFTDADLKKLSGETELPHTKASFKMVDTCGAEFDAQTPYFYSSFESECESRPFGRSGKPVILVLGSGPIRIGQGIEFDYSSVHCVHTLKEMGYDVVIVNNNPETVSTDYDTADRLYFEPLTPEDVMHIIDAENPIGVVVAFGGQTAIKLTSFLDRQGIKILGTSASGIDIAEDREKFDRLLGTLGISRPAGLAVNTLDEALEAAKQLGYPVLLRPSYVIGGQNMKIVHNEHEARVYMERILANNIAEPVLVDKYMEGTELEVDVISDGKDILIPGIMEHIERAGVHSGDSIAVYPPYNLNDMMTDELVECSANLALSLGTKGLVNIQYLIYQNKLYVIEVNPRASRTVPYMSKVSGVPMVDIASRVMLGEKLKDLGYGTGLYKTPPYCAVKVPVFSFEKLADVNSYLGPEMKSTGEVLGIGKNLTEALFKGLTAAGMTVPSAQSGEKGVLLSVDTHDLPEIVSLAKKLDDLSFRIYATPETSAEISTLGIDVETVRASSESDRIFRLMENGKINYIVYTGALLDSTVDEYIALHRRALRKGVPCFTSLDTANAFADIIAGRFTQMNTELVDINNMRKEHRTLHFEKLQATGDDYIFAENFNGEITCPESLSVSLCARHTGIGAYGLVLMEKSDIADVKMRLFNSDGTFGGTGGNAVRCVGKYLYDNKLTDKNTVTVETPSGVVKLKLFISSGEVSYVCADMGKADFTPSAVPVLSNGKSVIEMPYEVGGKTYSITCLSMGNPHCVVFTDRVDKTPVDEIGPLFENAPIFPERTNTEFVRVVNKNMIKMRVWERGNGETYACGTGACAAVAAAVKSGLCSEGEPVTVKVRGGDLTVTVTENGILLTGNAERVFKGEVKY